MLLVREVLRTILIKRKIIVLITEKIDNSFYPDAKYVVIAINTTQLEEATERYVKLIVIMMSFLATIYRG